MSKRKASEVIAPRKEPKQTRSRQTYQVILTGASEVIRRDGLKKLSTNRVAEEAGLSIGSLYQYFPSKAAIVAALIDQYFENEFNEIKAVVGEVPESSGPRVLAETFFHRYYRLTDKDLAFRRDLVASVSEVQRNEAAKKFHGAMAQFIVDELARRFGVGQKNLKPCLFLLGYILKGISISSVDTEVQNYDRNELVAELAEQLLHMIQVKPA